MFLGIFQMIPLILVITLQDRKTLFCVFYCFRDLYGLKLTGDFSRIIIFQILMDLSFETTQTESGGRKEQGWRIHPPGHATCTLRLLEHHQPYIKSSRRFPWPKNPLYKGPRGVSSKRRRVDQKHRNSAIFSHHRRGTLLRSRHRRDLLPLQDQEPHHHNEEGVVHLWTMAL